MHDSAGPTPLQSLPVYRARSFRVSDGANLGDALGDASELTLDDIYTLTADARRERLAIATSTDAGSHKDNKASLQATVRKSDFAIAPGSELGAAGAPVFLDSVATFMSPEGLTVDTVILVEVDPADGAVAAVYLLPLAPLLPRTPYRLVGVDVTTAKTRFGEVACVSFTRSTLITLADGRQCPIEELSVGDRLLTRDNGPQAVRWIGQNTLRALGEFAPIVIRKGALNNENDLTVSPNHRLFVYQRTDKMGVGRSEILVKARHLVNGETVIRQQGGFVEYFQLLFDRHQIIYAEGIAAESLLLDTRTCHALPRDLSKKLTVALRGHGRSRHQDFEVSKLILQGRDAAELLRRASAAK
ncbi:MAG: Hint domain-containing protein [Halocynthiibacter sp.]